jgi:hypothetical protein
MAVVRSAASSSRASTCRQGTSWPMVIEVANMASSRKLDHAQSDGHGDVVPQDHTRAVPYLCGGHTGANLSEPEHQADR